jgi:hypothetical protein
MCNNAIWSERSIIIQVRRSFTQFSFSFTATGETVCMQTHLSLNMILEKPLSFLTQLTARNLQPK